MSDTGDGIKYKWTSESTSLLVSVWSDKQVQKQLEYAAKPQLIWESVARYMKKKGYNVSGKQCRSRMKQVLVCYREAKRAGTRDGVEQYYELIDRVLKNKRLEENNINGIDTVDAAINVKSPPKEVKTNKNLQMRYKFQEPVQSFYRTEALSPTWIVGRENEYPDSPESNETVIARPYTVFSPTRDVAINTGEQLAHIAGKSVQCNTLSMEEPLHANYKQNLISSYPYGEVPFQNTVQNVQNHIIQENMQQHQNVQQNHLWNQQNLLANNVGFQQNMHNVPHGLISHSINNPMQANLMSVQNMQQQNLLQQTMQANNRAMPQEPRKIIFGKNLSATYKQHRDMIPQVPILTNMKQSGSLSPDYSPDISQNLNDAFCESSKGENKTHNLNETFNQPTQLVNPPMIPTSNISVVTNNATCNDDSLLLELLMNSPTPSETDNKSRDTAVNTDGIPHAPVRKKKAQKLEQLVLSAISSQNEVVNKILAAQNDMVSKFLDVDRDRQNRLENRLDDLLKVVHASVLNKQVSEPESEIPAPLQEPTITSLVPPPKPGTIPPKLDLVPPKPCRVPCTVPNSNIELINQKPVPTRPGIVSPILSPSKKPGTIWSKLGPVSQSPFVKAQQRLGFQPVLSTETRTQSSAERRIAKEVDKMSLDTDTLIFETNKLLEMERQLEEKVENARLEVIMGQTLHARRRLFTQREPTAAMILTAAFLESECRAADKILNHNVLNIDRGSVKEIQEDNLLAGQGESYERLRQLNIQPHYLQPEPCDTSTPAKLTVNENNGKPTMQPPKQTIQQLAQLVMNTGRWKDVSTQNQQRLSHPIQTNLQMNQNICPDYNEAFIESESNVVRRPLSENDVRNGNGQYQPQDWTLHKRGNSANEQKVMQRTSYNTMVPPKPKFPMGFTTTMLDGDNPIKKEFNGDFCKSIGFNNNVLPDRKQQSVRFMDEALAELERMYIDKISEEQQEKSNNLVHAIDKGNSVTTQNRQMIERYIRDTLPRKQFRDNREKETDSDNDEEFLDTTATIHAAILPRRGSLTSTGTASTETAHLMKFNKADNNCVIS